MDPTPPIELSTQGNRYQPESPSSQELTGSQRSFLNRWLPWVVALGLCSLHVVGITLAMGGLKGVWSPWPLSLHDHPIYVHTTWIGPDLIRLTGTDAGYDPYFMAGAPKSVIFPQTAAYFELFGVAARPFGLDPARAHKLAVLLATILPPFLVLAACMIWRFSPEATGAAVLLFLIYVWTNGGGAGYPLNFAWYGMVPYLLAVPLSLVGLAVITRWLGVGGLRGWLGASLLLSLAWLVHITTPMLLGPAGLLAYISVWNANAHRLSLKRHLALWSILGMVAVLNIWWWLPGLALAETRGDSKIAFFHPEPVWQRLREIVTTAPPIQALLLALVGPGLWLLRKRDRTSAWGLFGFSLAGFGWGYLAGGLRQIDFLQPGRHTYAFYVACALAGGVVWGVAAEQLTRFSRRLKLLCVLGLLGLGFRLFGPPVIDQVGSRLGMSGGQPFLSSQPSGRFLWILDQLKTHMQPGQRLLYEESGEDLPGIPDPYQGHRYSGLLPWMTGVEVIGGPYLRVALSTNYVQFGEDKLLGQSEWGPEQFLSACRSYGPSGMVCWSPRAIKFCREHPDLIQIVAEHEETFRLVESRTGRMVTYPSRLIFAKILGNSGPVLRGTAEVMACAGAIEVKGARTDELDGLVVLRYHLLPWVRSKPSVTIKPVRVIGDPVPLIGFEPIDGPVRFELDPPP